MRSTNRDGLILKMILGGLILLMLLRFFPPLRFVLIPLFMLSVLGVAVAFGWYSYAQNRRNRAYEQSTEGQIERRLIYCREQIERNEAQLREIDEEIEDLEDKLARASGLAPQNQQDTEQLIAGFKAERNLREAKAAFFEACVKKLENMLNNHRLSHELANKKKRLDQLRENNYEDLADLEALRSDVEMNFYYLDTIEKLSQRMLQSTTVDDARHLRLELEKMTDELGEL